MEKWRAAAQPLLCSCPHHSDSLVLHHWVLQFPLLVPSCPHCWCSPVSTAGALLSHHWEYPVSTACAYLSTSLMLSCLLCLCSSVNITVPFLPSLLFLSCPHHSFSAVPTAGARLSTSLVLCCPTTGALPYSNSVGIPGKGALLSTLLTNVTPVLWALPCIPFGRTYAQEQ